MAKNKEPKTKKKPAKQKKKSSVHIDEPIELKPNDFEMPGVTILTLSELTQKAIGCIVGETITTEQPWVYIKKETLEDNLDLHEESSEFLPIKDEIQKYPEDQLLMGIDVALHDEQEEFFICLTKEAKQTVLLKIEQHQQEMQDRLKNSIIKEPRPWECLGSDTDVDDELLKNLRSLLEIEVRTRYPLYTNKVKFSERSVEAAVDGYVELLPTRFQENNIYKRRVDSSVQASPETTPKIAQTNPVYPTNKFTQYNYEYDEPTMKLSDYKQLNTFFQTRIDHICDAIRVNGYINLHEDDYMQLMQREQSPPMLDHREICILQDVVSCKGMKVSSVCWHPLISGLLAAAYIRTPYSYICTEERPSTSPNDSIHAKHLVLIWSYSDNLLPKLYLYADREVYIVSFCPTNPNILAGGLANGQIVLWDITGCVERVEARKIRTLKEIRHSMIMHSMMKWMKCLNSEAIVLPTVISDIDYGHTSAVNNLLWLSTSHEITSNGKVVTDLKAPSLQFITCGTDGLVFIWDLNRAPGKEASTRLTSNRGNRLGGKPSALTLDVSPLSHLNKVLYPHYRLVAENPATKLKVPITNISIHLPKHLYSAVNPATLPHILERTYFEHKSELPYAFKPEFTISSSIGFVGHCTWEGYDFDQGQRVNSEFCKVTSFHTLHDGPVRCSNSPFYSNVFITLGGRVFAIWNLDKPKTPILWRKSKSRYIFAIWSLYNPSLVILARIDSHFELWDLSQTNRHPARIQKLTGNVFIDGFTEPLHLHVRKNTIAISDQVGALKIYHLHESFTREQMELFYIIQRVFDVIEIRKKVLKEWRAAWIERYAASILEETLEVEKKPDVKAAKPDEEPEKPAPVIKLTPAQLYHIRQEKFMYQTLLEKKKLNIVEIEQHKIPLQKLMDEDKQRQKKQATLIGKKDVIFQRQKYLTIKGAESVKRPLISVRLSDDQITPIKCGFMTSFKETEQGTLAFIEKNTFRYRFDWVEMMMNCKQRSLEQYVVRNRTRNNSTEVVNVSTGAFGSSTEYLGATIDDVSDLSNN